MRIELYRDTHTRMDGWTDGTKRTMHKKVFSSEKRPIRRRVSGSGWEESIESPPSLVALCVVDSIGGYRRGHLNWKRGE